MSETSTEIICSCGKFRALLKDVDPKRGTHMTCHCDDCRAFERVLRPDLAADHGVAIYQTNPGDLSILDGVEKMRCLKLSPNGLLRWYASCCDTPMFNTMRSPTIPFVGVLVANAARPELFGPVRVIGYLKGKDGKVRHKGIYTMVSRMARRMIPLRLSGGWKNTPFFTLPDKLPVSPPELIDKERKSAAYKR